MEKNIVISNPKRLEEIKRGFLKGGAGKIHILSDFDRTLTQVFVDGEKIPSLLSILRSEKYLTPDYAEKANVLFDKYNPIEINPTISIEDKKKAMKEWWEKHFELLKECGLKKEEIEKAMQSNKIKLRKGVSGFLNFLYKHDIPLVVISSSGLGEDSISLCLQKNNVLYSNIHIISNSLIWDEEGNMIGTKEPIIHCMNKDQTMVKDFPVYSKIKDRQNVILLGDSLGNIGMIEGFDYDNLIKIGFLNDEIDKNLEEYKKNYDILILNDSSIDYVNDLMNEIVKNNIL